MAKFKSKRSGVGLKQRPDKDGNPRPRWEPWPAARKIGIRGRDLKDQNGNYITIGQAIDACDHRTKWSRAILNAIAGNRSSANAITESLMKMPILETEAHKLNYFLCSDLIETAQKFNEIGWGHFEPPQPAKEKPKSPNEIPILARTVSLAIDFWLKSLPNSGKNLSINTIQQYTNNARRVKDLIGNENIRQRKKKDCAKTLNDWIKDHGRRMTGHFHAVSSGVWEWAILEEWVEFNPWRGHSLPKPEGRIVIWEVHETKEFAEWCDINGFQDVADAIIFMEWIGHNSIDYCKAKIKDLETGIWTHSRQKTSNPFKIGLTKRILQRLELRKQREYPAKPFDDYVAIDVTNGLRLTEKSVWQRYNKARNAAIAQNSDKWLFLKSRTLQDLRDTCITRLIGAGIEPALACQWTGHSVESAEKIWKSAYVANLDITAKESAQKLEAFTNKLEHWNKSNT